MKEFKVRKRPGEQERKRIRIRTVVTATERNRVD